jgi:hypothetical protein
MRSTVVSITHHKFVNTTPKPNATKNSRGELVGPLVGCCVVDIEGLGDEDVEEAVCAMRDVGSGIVDVLVSVPRAST